MYYHSSVATAVCTIAGLDSTRTAALAVYDYLVNHPDKIPEALNDDDVDSDSAIEIIEAYLSLHGEDLTISYESGSKHGNYDSELFDFLSNHFSCLQTSPYMVITWSSLDSRTGTASGVDYYDRQGQVIDIDALLTAHFS